MSIKILAVAAGLIVSTVVSAASLQTVVNVLAIPDGHKLSPNASWDAVAKIPGIKWRDTEPTPRARDYIRSGAMQLKGLGGTSITWSGLPDAAIGADLRTAVRVSPDKYADMLKAQLPAVTRLRLVQGPCNNDPIARHSAVYEVAIPDRRPLFVRINTRPGDNNGNTTIQVSPDRESSWMC